MDMWICPFFSFVGIFRHVAYLRIMSCDCNAISDLLYKVHTGAPDLMPHTVGKGKYVTYPGGPRVQLEVLVQ